jgi:hypothetical protein
MVHKLGIQVRGGALDASQVLAVYVIHHLIVTGNLADVPLSSDQRSVTQWFNTGAGFDRNSSRQLSNNIRTLSTRFAGIRGDSLNNWDISLVKNTTLKERARLQFRTEFVNAFNHPQFALPNSTPTSGSFGRVTSTTQWPRTIQFGLKLIF